MENEKQIECLGCDGTDLVGFGRNGEHHMQEIGNIIEIVSRIDERMSDGSLISKCSKDSDF
jgi:hypothetical protein